jgi:peptide/nickel transport system substrate-binding protein
MTWKRPGGRRRIAALAVAGALLAGACSSDDGAGGGGGTDVTADKAASDTLTAVAPAVLSSLDPERYEGNISLDLMPNLAGTLLWWDEPAEGSTALQTPDQVVPALAESYEVSEDGKRILFTLRDDAESPFGNTVTSEDVKWSFERMIASEGVPIARILLNQAGWDLENPIEVVDERSFYANVARPNAVSLSVVTTYYTMIFDTTEVLEHVTDDDPWASKWLAENDASYGAYTVDSLDPGKEVRLVPNPGYYGETPAFTEVVLRATPDGSNRLQLIERGEVDLAYGLTFDQLSSLENKGSVKLEKGLFPSVMLLVMNHDVEPFGDPRVRQAISYAIDRDALVKAAYQGFGTPATDFFHVAFGYEEPDTAIERDLDRARGLLAEAGVEDLGLELSYSIGNLGPEVEQMAVLLKAQLAEIGVNVTINNVASNADFDAAKRDGSLQAWLATSAPQIPDPAYYIQTFYGSKGIVNLSGYANPELDALAIQILETPSGSERDALIEKADEMMIEDMPMAPLVDPDKYYVLSSSIDGFTGYAQDSVTYSRLVRVG